MSKILEVTKPFFVMEPGDTFESSADGNVYVSEFNMEHHEDDENSSVMSSYSSKYTISKEYAQELVKDGYLQDKQNDEPEAPFVNVFDEISRLAENYSKDLSELNRMDEHPAVAREKEVVLTNLITMLNYLNGLKR